MVGSYNAAQAQGAPPKPVAGKADGPRAVGNRFVMPRDLRKEPSPTTSEEVRALAKKLGHTAPEPLPPPKEPKPGVLPKRIKMRGGVVPYRNRPGYAGMNAIFQYTNSDGKDASNTCGQAAIATLLTYWGLRQADKTNGLVRMVERSVPPDGIKWLGFNGTTAARLEWGLGRYGLKHTWVGASGGGRGDHGYRARSREELKKWVAAGYPVMVMVDVGQAGWGVSGLHWTVVYAYDDDNVYLTNWSPEGTTQCSWANFENGWHAQSIWWQGKAGKALLVWRPGVNPPRGGYGPGAL